MHAVHILSGKIQMSLSRLRARPVAEPAAGFGNLLGYRSDGCRAQAGAQDDLRDVIRR